MQALELLLNSHDDSVRRNAAKKLSLIDEDWAFEALVRAVEGEKNLNPYRYDLLQRLLDSPRASLHEARLLTLLAQFADSYRFAADFIAKFPAGRKRLRAALVGPNIDQIALEALAAWGDRESVPVLLDRLQGEVLSWQVPDVIRALGEIGDARAVNAIASYITTPGNAPGAAAALCQIGPAGIEVLVGYSNSPQSDVRDAVSVAFTDHQSAVREYLMRAIPRARVKTKARMVRVLATIKDSSTWPLFARLLHDRSPVVRLATVEAVGVLPQPWIEDVGQLLQDPIPEIRAAAARAVGVSSHGSFSRLASLVDDPHPAVRIAVAEALGASGMAAARAPLLKLLADTDTRVRVTTARSLVVGGDGVIPTLSDLLLSPEQSMRYAAAQSLAQVGARGIDVLNNAARSPRTEVRKAIAASVAYLANDRLGIVLKMLDDPEQAVRIAAAKGVAERSARDLQADPESPFELAVVDALGRHLPGDTEDESRSMLSALVAMRDDRVGPAVAERLSSALLSTNGDLVRAAALNIQLTLGSQETTFETLPGWFSIREPEYWGKFAVSQHALDVASALEVAASRGGRVGSAARAASTTALATIDRLLRKIDERSGQGQQEQHEQQELQEQQEGEAVDRLSLLVDHLRSSSEETRGHARYLDAAFFDDVGQLRNGSALHQGRTYILEVAVRATPQGLPVVGDAQPLPALAVEVDRAEITVVADTDDDGVTFDRNVSTLTLPAAGDSTHNARFAITPTRPTMHPGGRLRIRLWLYYQFCLLESAVIEAEVVSKYSPEVRSAFDMDQPITLEHDRIQRGYEQLGKEIPRSLHIDITWRELGYGLRFTWGEIDGISLSLAAELPLTRTALSEYLSDARRALVEVAMGGPYATQIEVDDNSYVQSIRRLAQAGQDLHTIMFRGDPHSPLAHIGELLAKSPLPPGSVIQVSTDKSASDFVFPWALMYDAPIPDEEYLAPETDGFWGARYSLEQTVPTQMQGAGVATENRDGSARMAYLLWDQFKNASEHTQMLQSLAERNEGQLHLGNPITRASDALSVLIEPSGNDIYYFYAHAHTRELTGEDDSLESALSQLTHKSTQFKELKVVYDRIRLDRQKESWIKLSHGQLKLRSLESAPVDFVNAPLVFVNACESGRLTPSLTRESFVNFFLTRGASAFVGTECTMTIVFGHAFGAFVLERLVEGDSIGTALLDARREFLRAKNPLGLAYSLYGNSGKAFPFSESRNEEGPNENPD